MDFTVGLVSDPISLNVRNPALVDSGGGGEGGETKINISVYLTIFSSGTWVAVLAAAVALAAAYSAVLRSSESRILLMASFADGLALASALLVQLSPFRALPNGGRSSSSSSSSLRSVLLTGGLLGFVLFNCYVGDLTATMTAGAPTVSIRSFQDVLEHGYRVHVTGGTVTEAYFSDAPAGSALRRVHEEAEAREGVLTVFHVGNLSYQEVLLRQVDLMAAGGGRDVFFESVYNYLGDDRVRALMDFQGGA